MKLVFVLTLCLFSVILDPASSSPNHSGYLIQHLVPYFIRPPLVYSPPPTYPPVQQFYTKRRPKTQRPFLSDDFEEPQVQLTSRRPKPAKPPLKSRNEMCEEVASRDIKTPSDLEPTWRILNILTNESQIQVDPKSILEPPLEPIPRPFPSIKGNKPFSFQLVFQQTIKLNLITSTTQVSTGEETQNSFPPSLLSADEIQATLNIYKVPTKAAPLRGNYDRRGNFEKGLENSKAARRNNATSSPVENFLENDLNFMIDLFQRLKDSETLIKKTQTEESLVELPQVISRVERNFIPEPDHSERTVLDFEFNFGLPAISTQFESPTELVKEVKRRRKLEKFMTGPKVLREFGSLKQFRQFVGEKIREDLTPQRRLGRNEFVSAEGKVQKEYQVSQFIVCTNPGQNDKCGNCRIDPILGQNQYVDFNNGGGGGGRDRPRG